MKGKRGFSSRVLFFFLVRGRRREMGDALGFLVLLAAGLLGILMRVFIVQE